MIVRIDAAEAEETLAIDGQRLAQWSEVLFDERRAEPIVSGWHRRVRREDDLRGDAPQCLPRVDAFDDHALADEFERGEGAVALVQVEDARRDTKRRQRADAADAKQQLLTDADAIVAAVQARGELAILGLVAFDVRVEQQQGIAADRELPHARGDGSSPRLHRHGDWNAVAQRRPHRQRSVVDVEVVLVLPAVAVQPLPEISLVVIEPDADERNAEVRGALDVIAGKNAEAARVNGERLVDAELGGEVRDRPRPEHPGMTRAPGVLGVEVLLQTAIGVVDAAVQRQLRRPLLEPVDWNLLQQRDRVVVERAPQDGIELAEEAGGVGIPTPPQVLRQCAQPLVCRRDELAKRPRLGDNRRDLRPGHRQQSHVLGTERARLDRLYDQHALEESAVDDRYAKERAVRILACLGEIFETRVRCGVGDELRPEPLGDEPRETLREPHPDAANAFGAEADSRRQDQIGAIRLQQVDRTDIGREPALDQMHDVVERLGGVAARRDETADFFERPERRVLVPRRYISDGAHRPSEWETNVTTRDKRN